MAQLPDFETIGRSLESAQPLEMYVLPFRAYVLVGQLQLALRHPQNTGPSAAIAREMALNLQEELGKIDPAIAQSLEQGWNPQMDMIDAEFEQARQTGELTPRVEVHNIYTLYELDEHRSRVDHPLLSFGFRPQDWGHPRWNYQFCKVEFELDGVVYVNNCHLWQEIKRDPLKAYTAIGEAMYWVMQPGQPPELCGRDYLAEEDFWVDDWGTQPPVWTPPRDDDYGSGYYDDPVVLYDEIDGPITDSQLTAIVNAVHEELNGEGDRS